MNNKEAVTFLYNAFRNGEVEKITDFISGCPASYHTEDTIVSIRTGTLYDVIAGMDAVVSSCYYTAQFEQSLIFSSATFLCVQDYLKNPANLRKDEVVYYAGSSSYYTLKFYLDTSNFTEGIAQYESITGYFADYLDTEDFIATLLTGVELYLLADEQQIASDLFHKIPECRIHYPNRVRYDSLREVFRRFNLRIATLAEEANAIAEEKRLESLREMINTYEEALNVKVGEPSEKEAEALKKTQNLLRELLNCRDDAEKLTLQKHILASTAAFQVEAGIASTVITLEKLKDQALDLANSIWEVGIGNERLQENLDKLIEMLPRFERAGKTHENWHLMYIASVADRIEQSSIVLSSLEKLRTNLEAAYERIAEKKDRGGVFSQFPPLFPMLVTHYYLSGNVKGVLNAVEAGKGRFLRQESREGKIPVDYGNLVQRLSETLAAEKAHYLTFFVGNVYTVSVLSTSDGRHFAKGVEVSREAIDGWVKKRFDSPSNWNKKQSGFFGSKEKVNMSKELEKLLEVIGRAMEEGSVNEGDHIVYSEDENLILFPLQYIHFRGKYLIESFTISRVHSAYQLIELIERKKSKPREAVCFSAPSRQDIENEEKSNAFTKVQGWLKKCTKLAVLVIEPDVENLPKSIKSGSLVHFATHGIFPTQDFANFEKNSSFYNSGLLLNSKGKQPVLDVNFDYYKTKNLFNPRRLLELGNLMEDCHVTFQACVSGRAKEGVAGDAIGMEWAAFSAGATSMLSAAWDIDIFWVNEFCISFYDMWLNKKMSKAQAYRETALQLMKSETPAENPKVYYWGGLILSGNWK